MRQNRNHSPLNNENPRAKLKQYRCYQTNPYTKNPQVWWRLPQRTILAGGDAHQYTHLCAPSAFAAVGRQTEGSALLRDDFTTLRGRFWTPCGLPELIYELGRCVRVLAACLVQFEENSPRKKWDLFPRGFWREI